MSPNKLPEPQLTQTRIRELQVGVRQLFDGETLACFCSYPSPLTARGSPPSQSSPLRHWFDANDTGGMELRQWVRSNTTRDSALELDAFRLARVGGSSILLIIAVTPRKRGQLSGEN
ncbi:hypothetical protein PIB30_028598 [Stylosanthes scabra]|uniref:Uncharacterized protein n=1 Tax=Stylosanthes scabra TaxID=79078 RepID=A0ABU6XCR9_9FABA|nr:hypothetical protein [Stylosanthes scabra]